MEEIVYRPLEPSDYHEYRRVRLECLQQHPENFGSTYEEELYSKSMKMDNAIKDADPSNFVFGAFVGHNRLVGICGLLTDMRLKTRHRGEIVQVYVDPAFSGNGVGKKLLQLSVDKAFQNTETVQIILGVVYSNDKAVKLYSEMGFIEYGRLEKFFKLDDKYFTQLFLRLTKEAYA